MKWPRERTIQRIFWALIDIDFWLYWVVAAVFWYTLNDKIAPWLWYCSLAALMFPRIATTFLWMKGKE